MTFENFYPGNSYKFEFAAAKAVADHPNGEYSPLIFCGPCGIGKTHLLSSIVHRAKNARDNCEIIHISAEDFADELITSIRKGETKDFREKYDNIDMLLIDDFDFVAGKEHTQEEIFRIFDSYLRNKKQIVLCLNDSHGDYTFAPKIASRLCGGIVLNMKLPDKKTKEIIVKGISKELKLEFDDNIKQYLVEKCNNANEIQGLLKHIKMIFDITNEYPSLDKIKTLFPLSK